MKRELLPPPPEHIYIDMDSLRDDSKLKEETNNKELNKKS